MYAHSAQQHTHKHAHKRVPTDGPNAGGSADKAKEKKVVEDDLESAMGPVDAAVQESRSEMARVSAHVYACMRDDACFLYA